MAERPINEYSPDRVSPPGDSLAEALDNRSLTQADLSRRTGLSKKAINEIVRGKAPLSPETALKLEAVLGIPAKFWMERERRYAEHLARLARRRELAQHVAWLQKFPVREMVRLKWVEDSGSRPEMVEALLRFFGIASPAQWDNLCAARVNYHRSSKLAGSPGALGAWLRRGYIEAQRIRCGDFDKARFRAVVQSARELTREVSITDATARLRDDCAESGVALVFVPELPKTHVSGATCWLSPSTALIQLSLRYKRNDFFWFAFFHEAGHILLHGKRLAFIDVEPGKDSGDFEDAANRFAARTLIPPQEYGRFVRRGNVSAESVVAFAEEVGIAPGIVVGRLQHDRLVPFNRLNHLKRKLCWAAS